jgi:hypothetical protein
VSKFLKDKSKNHNLPEKLIFCVTLISRFLLSFWQNAVLGLTILFGLFPLVKETDFIFLLSRGENGPKNMSKAEEGIKFSLGVT